MSKDKKNSSRNVRETKEPKSSKDTESKDSKKTELKEEKKKNFRQAGGVYFHSGAIMGRKNVFVTSEYADLLVNAIKTAELKMDIKNLAYVVMPNFFYWMFRLSAKQDNPSKVYGKVKGEVAFGILDNLRQERTGEQFELLDIFKNNERVGRSSPDRLIWSFEEFAKKFEQNKRYRIWAPKTEISLIDSDELLQKKLKVIEGAPVRDRWQMVEKSEDYPYLYISDELKNSGAEPVMKEIQSAMLAPAGV